MKRVNHLGSIKSYHKAKDYIRYLRTSLDFNKARLHEMIKYKIPYYKNMTGKYTVADQLALVLILLKVKKSEIISMTFDEQLTYLYLFGE